MSTFPEISVEQRDEQPYVGATAPVTMDSFAPVADRFPEVFGWVAERGLDPVGPPFFRYRVIDMAAEMIVQAGVPLAAPVSDAEDLSERGLQAGVLPAGRYVTTTYVGDPRELVGVTAGLLHWVGERGLTFDLHQSEQGEVWGSRLELLWSDPREVPAEENRTTLAFRLAD
jgi:hypothetical protein